MEASGGHGNDLRTASNHGAARDGLGGNTLLASLGDRHGGCHFMHGGGLDGARGGGDEIV